jgi:hypothetical protein
MNPTSPTSTPRLRIIVLGYVIRGPLGGMVWSNLQYLIGLADLGHDVWFVEDSDNYPSCYDPARGYTDTDPTYGLRFASEVFSGIGFADRWAYYDAHFGRWHGPRAADIVRICREADLVLNLACVNPLRDWTAGIPVRVYLDEDPAFNQIRHLTDPAAMERASQHTVFFTFGENIASGAARLPRDGFHWRATRQPVVLNAVKTTPGRDTGKFSTVMQWQSYKAVEYDGLHYGMKAESFASLEDLPAMTGPVFDLAVGGSAPRDLLRRKGWGIRDSLEISRDPWMYENFIRDSKAEFGIAKQGYVTSRCGWFSERSVCYLASGRPVVAQETGFSRWLKVEGGLVPFNSVEEAAAGVREIERRYSFHCRLARQIAEEYFDSRKVLVSLIDEALNAKPA